MISLDWTIGVQLGIFLFSVLILNLLLFKPVLKTIAERDSRTRGNEEEAEALSKKTEIKVHSYERRMTAARQRAAEERRRIAKEGAEEERALLERTRAESTKTVEAAAREVEAARDAARAALRQDVQALALEIASKVAGRTLGAGGAA